MNDIAEYRRLKFFEALRSVLALAVCLAAIAAVAFCHGCASAPVLPAGAYDFVTNAAQRAVVVLREARERGETASAGEGDAGSGDAPGVVGGTASPEPDDRSTVSSPALVWRYGGFDGSKAVEDPRCRVSLVSITKDRIAYKWASGIPADWKRGKTSKGMMVVACAFYRDGEKWVGGKMDWTDEARTVREATHIHDGYNGWQSAGWDSASRRAFCVVSADGRYRSNLLED